MTQAQLNALRCAIAVLDGSAGGYTLKEKYDAKVELMALLVREQGR
jgi:hypothetical protein